jgi:hypothetical protein
LKLARGKKNISSNRLNRLIKRHQSDQKPIQKCALNKQNVPVFPLVASTTVIPGFNFPLFSASSITANAKRSFTDDNGLKYSHLTYNSTPSGANLFILTTGVSPIKDVMFSWITAFGARETLDVRLTVVFTARGHVEMDWVNDNMVDVIDRLNRIVALFGPTVFSKREEKRERTTNVNVNARKVNDA